MYLVFDTQTSGEPLRKKAPVTDLKSWPRIVQLAWIVFDENGNTLSKKNYLVRPRGFFITPDAVSRHGITTEYAWNNGSSLLQVLRSFAAAVEDAAVIVAHDMGFEEKITGAEFLRTGLHNPLPGKTRRCTMRTGTPFCKIPGPYGNKWPTLQELHTKLFGSTFAETHTALGDAQVCGKCFFEMKKRGLF